MANGISRPVSDAEYQARQDLQTLMECEAIEKDPKRLKAARALAKKKMAELTNVMGDKD